jgi:hypothetical protein
MSEAIFSIPDNSVAAPPTEHEGEWAIVELFGHVTLVGRIAEVDRFGVKMLAIEALFRGELLPAVFYAGAAIYRLTLVPKAIAYDNQLTESYQLPVAIRSIVPALLLAAPAAAKTIEPEDDSYFDPID